MIKPELAAQIVHHHILPMMFKKQNRVVPTASGGMQRPMSAITAKGGLVHQELNLADQLGIKLERKVKECEELSQEVNHLQQLRIQDEKQLRHLKTQLLQQKKKKK